MLYWQFKRGTKRKIGFKAIEMQVIMIIIKKKITLNDDYSASAFYSGPEVPTTLTNLYTQLQFKKSNSILKTINQPPAGGRH